MGWSPNPSSSHHNCICRCGSGRVRSGQSKVTHDQLCVSDLNLKDNCFVCVQNPDVSFWTLWRSAGVGLNVICHSDSNAKMQSAIIHSARCIAARWIRLLSSNAAEHRIRPSLKSGHSSSCYIPEPPLDGVGRGRGKGRRDVVSEAWNCQGWLGGVVVQSRTSDSEVAGSSPTRTAVE